MFHEVIYTIVTNNFVFKFIFDGQNMELISEIIWLGGIHTVRSKKQQLTTNIMNATMHHHRKMTMTMTTIQRKID